MTARLTDEDIDAAFDLFDTDGSGRIDQEELTFALKGLGFPNVSKADALQIFKHLDKEGTGTIDKVAFRSFVHDKMKTTDSPEEILAAFKMFDINNTGKISYSNLYEVCKKVTNEEEPNEELLRDVLKTLDHDGDGEIGWEDWKYAMAWVNRKRGDVSVNRWNHFNITPQTMQSPRTAARRKSAAQQQDERIAQLLSTVNKNYETPKQVTISGTTVSLDGDGKISKASAFAAVSAINPVSFEDFSVLFAGEDTDKDDKITLTQYKSLMVALGEE
eukprot:PhF_6_TR1574/c0_g1_i1/m.2863/K16465/CETN1; centrin-1